VSTIGEVSHQVVVDLALLAYHQPTTLGSQRRLHVLHAEASQALAVLHHDHGDRTVRQQSFQLAARPIQARAHLAHRRAHGKSLPSRPRRQPPDLALQVLPLIRGRHARLKSHSIASGSLSISIVNATSAWESSAEKGRRSATADRDTDAR